MTEHETVIPFPDDSPAFVRRLVEAIPDWSDLTGCLEAPLSVPAVPNLGFRISRFGLGPEVVRREGSGSSTDWAALLLGGRPGFVRFDEIGYGRPSDFAAARSVAAGFVGEGYSGWLRFSGGDLREYAHEVPAGCTIHIGPWRRQPGLSRGDFTWEDMPPAVVVGWSQKYGGRPEDLEPILKVCSSLPSA